MYGFRLLDSESFTAVEKLHFCHSLHTHTCIFFVINPANLIKVWLYNFKMYILYMLLKKVHIYIHVVLKNLRQNVHNVYVW